MDIFKRSLALGITSGILAGAVSLIYNQVYDSYTGADFSSVIKPVSVLAGCLFGAVLAAIGSWLFHKWMGYRGEIVFNLVFVILSFASILAPIAHKLPLTLSTPPELFPGLVVPMHFFPALGWFTLRPLFVKR